MDGTKVSPAISNSNSNHASHTQKVKPINNTNPGSRHTRTSSIASNRPAGHGRTPSADHLMVPERADTAPQRRRQDSLDTLKRQQHAHSLPHQQHHLPPHQSQQPIKDSSHTSSSQVKQERPQPREAPRTPKPRSATVPAESHAERHTRLRKLSSREMLYPSPEAAKQAFEAQRVLRPPPVHRRPPTPHTSSRRTSSSVKRVDSDRSIRSRVSFDSTRSRRSDRSRRSYKTDDSDSDGATVGRGDGNSWEPHFGATSGIGPAGEAIEVIGLGRKKPRHRTFNARLLKPALRSTSRVNSTANLRDQGGVTPRPPGEGRKEKPLPSRPMSYVASTIGDTFSRLAPSTQKRSRHASHQPQPSPSHFDDADGLLGASASVSPRSLSRAQSRAGQYQDQNQNMNQSMNGNNAGLRSLFSSLSIGNSNGTNSSIANPHSHSNISLNASDPQISPPSVAPSRSSRRHLILPADDLFTYLRLAEIASWDRWPLPVVSGKSRGIWGGKRSLGFDEMGWEWHRRLRVADEARMAGRMLDRWESAGRGWERGILDFLEENVPHHPIDQTNRWGTQIFALPADGYDTLEFYDEALHQAEDFGLLSWVTGTLLQTSVSTLHMLRYSSQTFTFHLIPSPRPPHLHHSSSSLPYEPPSPSATPHFLWDGFGTMVLVNKSNVVDRAMVLKIRPPSVVDSGVIKEFAKGKTGEGWWAFYGETCVGDVGQANLLQAQVYDSCVQNQVFFFAVTNLKYWVFGQFNSNYTRCTVSTVVDRLARDPSLMQCLTAWVVRSVDERPRGTDAQHGFKAHIPSPPHEERRHRRPSQSARDPHPDLRSRHHHRSNSHSSFSLPPNPQGYDYPSPTAYPQPAGTVYPAGSNATTVFPTYGLPSYNNDLAAAPGMSPSPYPGLGMVGMNFNPSWPASQRAFSPTPVHGHGHGHAPTPTPMPYNFGTSWYGGGFWPGTGMR